MVDVDDLRAWASGCGTRGRKLCTDAADEIEWLRWMAYQPIADHKPECDCIRCVPF